MWRDVLGQAAEFCGALNDDGGRMREIMVLDKEGASKDPEQFTESFLENIDLLIRSGVAFTETAKNTLAQLITRIEILKAMTSANEDAVAAGPAHTKRSRTNLDASSTSLYEINEGSDAAGPSSAPPRKRGEDRDGSIPPKADSVEPQGSTGSSAGADKNRKTVFAKGDEVAFKPKTSAANTDGASDWILCEVATVNGEGKNRRYKVLDSEPDPPGGVKKEYRSTASSMIFITPRDQQAGLKPLSAGKEVLALYPDSTTFYRAEVDGMTETGMVNLKFEGDAPHLLQEVERRHVIEYRA